MQAINSEVMSKRRKITRLLSIQKNWFSDLDPESGSRISDKKIEPFITWHHGQKVSKNPTQSQIIASIQGRPNLYLEPTQPWSKPKLFLNEYLWTVSNGLNIFFSLQISAGKKIDVSLKILEDFYMTDSISRASPTMAKCVQAVKAQKAAPYVTS